MLHTLLLYHDYFHDNRTLWLYQYEVNQHALHSVFTWNDAMPSVLSSVSIATRVIESRGVLSWKDLQQPILPSKFAFHICCINFTQSAPSVHSPTTRLPKAQMYAVLSRSLNEILYLQTNFIQPVQSLYSWTMCFSLNSSINSFG